MHQTQQCAQNTQCNFLWTNIRFFYLRLPHKLHNVPLLHAYSSCTHNVLHNHHALGYRGFKHKLIVYEDQPPESNTTTVKTDKVQADCILWGTLRHCGALPTDGARWTNSTTKLKCGCLKQTHSYIPPHHQQPIKIQYIFCSVGNTRVTVKGGKHSVYFKHISSTRRAWQKFNNWKVVSKQLIAAYNQGWSTTMMRHCVSCVALCPPDVVTRNKIWRIPSLNYILQAGKWLQVTKNQGRPLP